ncbi:two-component system phosphate regulon sensor histidine kinase PhoR [Flavobacterium arsenatis]|uniref:histidine kinase n=1 Tax=Flavobacterium arsenatis TaxID=1484332 RepID=A0ABU1TLQ5_9FLAO|nr:HAMP domain-containing sensor histidine kinase [Flavobacterium arsenatis]MDR6966353.1 two-component system phosphate regulon sensor histidine kinase PhoR [Flavobacterium arsenatis]
MKSSRYKYILLFITITILATIGLQIFWNIKNYRENRVQLIKEVQTAFDNSIEYYYVEDSKNDFMAIVAENEDVPFDDFMKHLAMDSVFKKSKKKIQQKNNTDGLASALENGNSLQKADTAYSVSVNFTTSTTGLNDSDMPKKLRDSIEQRQKWKPTNDSTKPQSKIEIHGDANKISSVRVIRGKRGTDSISKLKNLVNKIIVSTFQDSIAFEKLSKAVDKELARRNITVDYSLQHFKADTIFETFKKDSISKLSLSAFSGTNFLPPEQKLQISFSDPTVLILKRSFTEILLSLALSLSIIFCLLYLLKTINKQKKIDEIKNDLISNITHEFKTPITTISSAIEGIRNFNDLDDKEKTNRYLNISGQQLKKLEIMVEKLLETASIDTNELMLNKETINVVELIKSNIEKHQMVASEKEIIFNSNMDYLDCKVDLFHFENAISNLIDNALKYGGKHINVTLSQKGKQTTITIEDNGIGIEKAQREKIFDKFYRIPKGNIHDVKGFGIGLFYSKKIIEKHGGTLELVPNTKTTIFKISFPDAK